MFLEKTKIRFLLFVPNEFEPLPGFTTLSSSKLKRINKFQRIATIGVASKQSQFQNSTQFETEKFIDHFLIPKSESLKRRLKMDEILKERKIKRLEILKKRKLQIAATSEEHSEKDFFEENAMEIENENDIFVENEAQNVPDCLENENEERMREKFGYLFEKWENFKWIVLKTTLPPYK